MGTGRLAVPDVPAARRIRKVLSLDVAAAVAAPDVFDVAFDTLGRRGRHGNEERSAAIHLSRKRTNASGRQIGAYLGGVGFPAVAAIVREVREDGKRKRSLNARRITAEAALLEKRQMKT